MQNKANAGMINMANGRDPEGRVRVRLFVERQGTRAAPQKLLDVSGDKHGNVIPSDVETFNASIANSAK